MITHVVMMVAKEKIRSYVKRTLDNDFIPFDIETYECLHYCFDSFFIAFAQTITARH